jgi:hypothetical protein
MLLIVMILTRILSEFYNTIKKWSIAMEREEIHLRKAAARFSFKNVIVLQNTTTKNLIKI